MTVISAAIDAGPLMLRGNSMLYMSGSLYIHNMTPELARQWRAVLEEIAAQE